MQWRVMMVTKKPVNMSYNGVDSDYYHILPEKKSLLGVLWYVFSFPIVKPLRLLQFGLGRLLSYVFLNPIFRKAEHENTALTLNAKYPDPVLSEDDDIVIVDILPEENFTQRTWKNWIHKIKSVFTNSPLIPSDLDEKHRELNNNTRIHQLLGQVATLINGKPLPGQVSVQKKFEPKKIHFRGLHHLSANCRQLLFQNLQDSYHHDFEQNEQQYKFYTLKTSSGAELDSVEVRGKEVASKPMADRTFIVSCCPRSNNYTSWLKQHRYYADQLGTTVVAFNYSGTGQSQGIVSSQEEMRQNTIAQVQRLIALGAKPENIGLIGESLGGNIATFAAAEMHRQGYPVKLFNSRSFRSSAAIILDKILPGKHANNWNPVNWGRWLLVGLVKMIIVPLLYLARWDLSVDKAFKSIPVDDRDFIVVRSKKDEAGHRYRDDDTVSHAHASIYSLVKEEQQRLQAKKEIGAVLTAKEQAWLQDRRGLHKFHVDLEQRDDAPTVNGHPVQIRYLVKTKPEGEATPCEDGRKYTLRFFQKVWQHQEKANDSDNVQYQVGTSGLCND